MRPILVCTGVLGGGTAIVFALAAMTAIALPDGATIASQWGGGVVIGKRAVAIEAWPVPVGVNTMVVDDVAPAPDVGEAAP
jgi:hypothetical protein